jgi:phage protein U
MIFAMLGDMPIGNAAWTGPTAAGEKRKATLVEHKVARGKPVVQDMGDELDDKTLEFFFDETFCEPQAELSKLEAAFDRRRPLAYVGGDGSFNGVRWIMESLDVKTLKTTPMGRPVRIKVTATMKEAPDPSPMSTLAQMAAVAAAGVVTGSLGLSLSVSAQVTIGPFTVSASASVSV